MLEWYGVYIFSDLVLIPIFLYELLLDREKL